MPSRNIAVQKAVYDALVQEKRPGESFTSVLRRLLDQRGGLEELSGAWGPTDRRAREWLRHLRSGVRKGR
jgi:predicted CopG family antitoxin